MEKMKLIAYYAIYNEAEYLSYSLRSIYEHVDKIIIIEGAWRECYLVNGYKRSNDGTLDIIKNFPDPDKKIEVYYHNEDDQLEQRNKIFDYLPREPHWLWLIDGDEVYATEAIEKIKLIIKENHKKKIVFRFKSLTFVNNFKTYYDVEYPRLFKITPLCSSTRTMLKSYRFSEPNDIMVGEKPLGYPPINREDIEFFHYSYCKNKKRFMEKKRERTKLWGNFAWNLDENGAVVRSGTNLREFTGKHPDVMLEHPRCVKE